MSPALRILLLALAVIDDVGAILVIALFYSPNITVSGFAILGFGILAIFALRWVGIRSTLVYAAPAFIVWWGAYVAGIHPTLAGVIVGLLTPVTAANREAVSPGERLQHSLHGVVAFGIMPLFAFANAGVPVGQIDLGGDAVWVFLGVTVGLVIGKPLGIVGLSWLAERSGIAVLSRGVQFANITVVGMAGGIGFTMALFIAQLAFPSGPLLETAKLAILLGSAVAAALAFALGSRILKAEQVPGAATTSADAETSTPT